MALFTEEGLRKGTKSKFCSAFTQTICVGGDTFVVGDGELLTARGGVAS